MLVQGGNDISGPGFGQGGIGQGGKFVVEMEGQSRYAQLTLMTKLLTTSVALTQLFAMLLS